MDWKDLLHEFAERPLFHTSMLGIFPDPPQHRQVQLSRWTKAGKLSQVRRGWYVIGQPWRTKELPPAYIANSVVHPSYLSLEWALQYHDMIPEYVPNPTSVTTERGCRFSWDSSLFIYYHVQPALFFGYRQVEVGGYKLNVAYPEKALLDKIYLFLQKNRFSMEWLQELRLQNLESFDMDRFASFIERGGWAQKHKKALDRVLQYLHDTRLEGEKP